MTPTQLKERVVYRYRRSMKALQKKELENYQTPTSENTQELAELRGEVRAYKKAIDLIDAFQNGNELPLEQTG